MGVSRFRRVAVAAATMLAIGGGAVAGDAPDADAAAFSMSLVGGSFSLATQGTANVGGAGSSACMDGLDNELIAPFGTPDALVDYPADQQCANPYDANETVAGMQDPDPVEFTGTIDGAQNFTVSSNFVPIDSTRTAASPVAGVCDDDLLLTKATTALSDLASHTGNLAAGTMTLNLRLGTTLDIRCDTDLGAGVTYAPFDFDGPGGMDPWGGPTPVVCAHNVSSTNLSASGDSAPASTSKTQAAGVTNPMTGKNLGPQLLFGDVFDALPIAGADTRCGFFNTFVFGTASADNSTLQFAFTVAGSQYSDLAGIDVNVGDATVPEGDGSLGNLGCTGGAGAIDCKNKVTVVVSLSEPAAVDSTITVVADNTTGGSANGTPRGNEILAPGPSDYMHITAARPKVLKIKAGKSTAKLVLNIVPDQITEASESILIEVVAVSAGLVENDGVGMVTIVDDDGSAPEPDAGISIGDATVYETGRAAVCGNGLLCKGTAVLPIVAETPVGADTTLSYTITNGTDVIGVFDAAEAINGKTLTDDFGPVLIAKTKIIKATKNTQLLVITVFGDNTDEEDVFSAETFTVRITGAGVRDGIGTVRINNDDT